jgi:methionine-rich copper-binding protein CopC
VARRFDPREDSMVIFSSFRVVRHRLSLFAAAAGVLVAVAIPASAHPALKQSSPSQGAVLDAAPESLRLTFTEPVESAFTRVKVVDRAGVEIAGSTVRADPGDPSIAVVALPALRPGAYTATWSALGRDGHRVTGELAFSVK